MDELLEIVMRDKAWNQEAARKTYVAILTLMSKAPSKPAATEPAKGALELTGRSAPSAATDPLVDQYRRKLSMALF
jgi:putative thioredoxin